MGGPRGLLFVAVRGLYVDWVWRMASSAESRSREGSEAGRELSARAEKTWLKLNLVFFCERKNK